MRKFMSRAALAIAIGLLTFQSGNAAIISDSVPALTGGFRSNTEDFFGIVNGTAATDLDLVTLAGYTSPNNTAEVSGLNRSTIPLGALVGRDLPSGISFEYSIAAASGDAFDASSINFSGTIHGRANTNDEFVDLKLYINDSPTAFDFFQVGKSGTATGYNWIAVTMAGNDGNSGSIGFNPADWNSDGIDFTMSLTASQITSLSAVDIVGVKVIGTLSGTDPFTDRFDGFSTAGELSANATPLPEPASITLCSLGGIACAVFGFRIRRRA